MKRTEELTQPAFNEHDFKIFMTSSTNSIMECYVIDSHSYTERKQNIAILKLSKAGSMEIPFVILRFNNDIYESKYFGRLYNQDVDGVYLADIDTVIFSSEYKAKDFYPLIRDLKIYTADTLKVEMEEHLKTSFREAVQLAKNIGSNTEYNPDQYEEGPIASWYLAEKEPIDYIGRNTELIKAFQHKPLEYMIRYVRGEDIVEKGLSNQDIDKQAGLLIYVEQKYREFKDCEEMKRNKEIISILNGPLKKAVKVTVFTKDGRSFKVSNTYRNYGGKTYVLGEYNSQVEIKNVDYLMYKKKMYPEKLITA